MTAALAFAAAIGLLALICGHKWGRWSRRHDYANGWDAGVAAERERWENVTGATWERLLAEVASDPPDVPGNDGWPYLFTNLKAAGERREDPPPTEVLMAEAAAQGYTGQQPAVPSVAEVDELAAEWHAVQGDPSWGPRAILNIGPPVVADITSARPSGLVRSEDDVRPEIRDAIRRAMDPDETPTLAGVVWSAPPPPDRTGPDWLEHQLAEMDRDARAYMRAMDADLRSHRLQIAAGRQP